MNYLGTIVGASIGGGLLTGLPWFLVVFVGFWISSKRGLSIGSFLLGAAFTIFLSGFMANLFSYGLGNIFVLFIIPIIISFATLKFLYSRTPGSKVAK